jgi:hypothetical protein
MTQGLTRRSLLFSSTCPCARSVLVYPCILAASSSLVPCPLVTAVAQPPASSRYSVGSTQIFRVPQIAVANS